MGGSNCIKLFSFVKICLVERDIEEIEEKVLAGAEIAKVGAAKVKACLATCSSFNLKTCRGYIFK